jgi:hypothetical protein
MASFFYRADQTNLKLEPETVQAQVEGFLTDWLEQFF